MFILKQKFGFCCLDRQKLSLKTELEAAVTKEEKNLFLRPEFQLQTDRDATKSSKPDLLWAFHRQSTGIYQFVLFG